MHAHDRMLGLHLPAADALVVGLALGGTGGRLEPMDAAQPVNDATHRLRETLVGHREIGPERVAAIGGMVTPRRMEALGGFNAAVMSVCHPVHGRCGRAPRLV